LRSGVLSAALGALLAPGAAAELGRTTTLPTPEGSVPTGAVVRDMDGDGLADLVVALASAEHRTLRIHLRRTGDVVFDAQPDHELRVVPEAVAFAVADVHTDPGSEIVLISGSHVIAWRPRETDERARFQMLFELDFLWQLPDAAELMVWQRGVRDVDGDGLDDLFLPRPGRFGAALQRREDGVARFEAVDTLVVPENVPPPEYGLSASTHGSGVSTDASGRELSLNVEVNTSGDSGPGPLLSLVESAPSPHLLDWDADGDLDVLAQGAATLYVWLHHEGRGFEEKPDRRFELPVERTAERVLDVSYSAHAEDLESDGRADLLFFAGDKRSKEVRTQFLLFGHPDEGDEIFGEDGRPTQLLVFAGFAGYPEFNDVDGDGNLDLNVGALRPDLIDLMRSASSETLEVETYVYLFRDGAFSKKPDLTHTLRLPVESSRLGSRFFGDVTGDGVRDFLIRDREDHLAVLYTRRDRNGSLSLLDKPLWELRIDPRSRWVVVEAEGGLDPEVLVLEPQRVLHVRFR
jgi:hypothetical protein